MQLDVTPPEPDSQQVDGTHSTGILVDSLILHLMHRDQAPYGSTIDVLTYTQVTEIRPPVQPLLMYIV